MWRNRHLCFIRLSRVEVRMSSPWLVNLEYSALVTWLRTALLENSCGGWSRPGASSGSSGDSIVFPMLLKQNTICSPKYPSGCQEG